MAVSDMTGIHISSGVNEAGKAFCTVTVENGIDIIAAGQLSPPEVRMFALSFLEAAEAAEQDSIVFGILDDAGLDLDGKGMFITDMRKKREERRAG